MTGINKPALFTVLTMMIIVRTVSGKSEASAVNVRRRVLENIQPELELLSTLKGHTKFVKSLCFSPDGMRLASGSGDSTVKIWNFQDVEVEPQTLHEHNSAVLSVDYNSDGTKLVSSSWDKGDLYGGTVKVWDIDNGVGSLKFTHDTGTNNCVVKFSPDGKHILLGSKDIQIWDVEDMTAVKQTLTGHSAIIQSLVFSPKGNRLASGSFDKTIKIWNWVNNEGTEIVKFTTMGQVRSMDYNLYGTRLASADVKSVKIWNVENYPEFDRALRKHSDDVLSVNFSQDGKFLASGSSDTTVKIWNVDDDYTLLRNLTGHTGSVNTVVFSADGKIASGSSDKTIRIWGAAPSSAPSISASPSSPPTQPSSSAPSLSHSLHPSIRPTTKILPTPSAAIYAPTPKNSSTAFPTLFVSLGCAALLVLCAVGVFFYKKRRRSNGYTSAGMSQSHDIASTNVMDASEPPNEAMVIKTSDNNSDTKHVLISARFDGGEKEQVARSLHKELIKIGVNSFMVETTGVGDSFGEQTVNGLTDMYAMVAVCYENYGEKTGSSYCSYYELQYALGHKIPVLPIKLCEEWPPSQCGAAGKKQNKFFFRPDLLFQNWWGETWNPKKCATLVKASLEQMKLNV